MSPSTKGLEKFLEEHPRLTPTEMECLYYRAGFADGALSMLNKIEEKVKENLGDGP